MKTFPLPLRVLCLLLPASVLGQGSLTPTGVPAPTMKSLDQVEARTPISAPMNIVASGSYYLTGNLSVSTGTALSIGVDDVTLDLNGFTIVSTASPAAGTAINLSGTRRNITIKNGHIRGATTFAAGTFTTGGFLNGIVNASSASTNLRVSGVGISGVGQSGVDFILSTPGSRNAVEFCTVSVCGVTGIRAGRVRNCEVETTGGDAILADIAVNCFGESVGTTAGNDGIAASTLVDNCVGLAVAGRGVSSSTGLVTNSTGTSSTNVGLAAGIANHSNGTSTASNGLTANVAQNCTGTSTSGIGINVASSATNCVGVSDSSIGLAAPIATTCFGTSTSGVGMSVAGTANACRAKRDSGVALAAGIAIGCTVSGSGTVSSGNKFNGTP